MSALSSTDVLRPRSTFARAIAGFALRRLPSAFAFLRRVWPIPHFGKTFAVTRYDDVVEVFATDSLFGVPYKAKLDLLMDGQPFILGMADGPEYAASISALRSVIRTDDLPNLADRVETQAAAIIAGAAGRIEVVDALVRRISVDLVGRVLGVPAPLRGDLRVWGTRLFEYQFVSSDAPLIAEVKEIAPALRDHIQNEIACRRATPGTTDDVLARCLARQKDGDAWFTDANIRTALTGMIVGGPPQPPMVVPQALEQLLRRPDALAGAQAAARTNDDDALYSYVLEAMRFDPLGPGLPRIALSDCIIAEGMPRRTKVPAGATVLACFESAMMDERRVADPKRFNPRRQPSDFIHFGHGVHECFGRYINRATLHLMLKPLLARSNLRRAPGREGHLRKNGAFAESLTVLFE
ncbi:MAG: cytochrome [Rhizorhabdus sp.]|nr:cytochrome [Rhizorhabdus sp.]